MVVTVVESMNSTIDAWLDLCRRESFVWCEKRAQADVGKTLKRVYVRFESIRPPYCTVSLRQPLYIQ